jgi:chemotaxis protein methyltransferase CheR
MNALRKPTTAGRAEENLVEGEYAFTESDFRRIAAMLREDSGIHLAPSKATLVYSRLAKRLRQLGLESFQDYCRLLGDAGGAEERARMMSALTTNLTRFFREPHHFDHLRTNVIAPMANAVRDGARLRIWSSACSTGEEPYSLALTVLSVMPDAPRYDVKILATDIDPQVVARAEAGIYSGQAVAPIPRAMRDRWMTPVDRGDGDEWSVGDDPRALISFRTLNLLADWPHRQRYQAVFCRNVVIYFEEETQNMLWKKFKGVMSGDGRLYVGHSERVNDTSYVSDGLTIYKLDGGAK